MCEPQATLERGGVEFTNGKKPGAFSFSIGSFGLLGAPAFAVTGVHNHLFGGRIGLVIVPTSMAVDHKT